MTLYQGLFGAEFGGLAPALRAFHGEAQGGRARGRLQVRRGRGLLARLAGWVIGAPPAGEAIVDMRVEVEGARELWLRRFGTSIMRTRQWAEGDRLVEALGPSQLLFRLEREASAMVYQQCGARLLGLPLPRALSPRVRARADASEAGEQAWDIEVDIALPLLGTIVGYSGTMHMERDGDG